MGCPEFRQTKDPSDTELYTFDFERLGWLSTGETVSSSTWAVPSGVTKVSSGTTSTTTTILISGGTHGEDYTILNDMTSSEGRIRQSAFILQVRDR